MGLKMMTLGCPGEGCDWSLEGHQKSFERIVTTRPIPRHNFCRIRGASEEIACGCRKSFL